MDEDAATGAAEEREAEGAEETEEVAVGDTGEDEAVLERAGPDEEEAGTDGAADERVDGFREGVFDGAAVVPCAPAVVEGGWW